MRPLYIIVASLAAVVLFPADLYAQELRVATYSAPLSRKGAGLLLRDIVNGEDTQIQAIQEVVSAVDPDVLVLTDFDYDADLLALKAFSLGLTNPYDYMFAFSPNAGVPSGFDLDEDGRLGEAEDAMGYGRFLGDGGMAVLSRYRVAELRAFHLNDLLWSQVPEASLPMHKDADELYRTLPLSTSGHWVVPLIVSAQTEVSLIAFAASPPVFDGPEDRNGLRNRDELRTVQHLLDGKYGEISSPVVALGLANIDPVDGDGEREALHELLSHSRVQDPKPMSRGASEASQTASNQLTSLSNEQFDTAQWPDEGLQTYTPGNLRVSYVLPDRQFKVLNSAVFWPTLKDPQRKLIGEEGVRAGAHRLVYVDLELKEDVGLK